MRRRLAGLLLAASTALGLAAAAPSAEQPVRATLTATGHAPKVGRPWYFMVRVTDRAGRPVEASILPTVLYRGRRLDTVGSLLIWGAHGAPYRWRRVHLGKPLTFQVQVEARGRLVRLNYAIRVAR